MFEKAVTKKFEGVISGTFCAIGRAMLHFLLGRRVKKLFFSKFQSLICQIIAYSVYVKFSIIITGTYISLE